MDGLVSDFRHVLRGIVRNPGYALFTILVFALAVGTVTPTYTLINAFVVRPLPFGDADALVHIWGTDDEIEWDAARVSVPDYLDWKRESRAFSGLAAFNYTGVDLSDGGRPEEIAAGRVSANFIDVLQRSPLLGRGFIEGEDAPGAAPVAILSEQLWRERYDSDPAILGRGIDIDGTSHAVVGVMPADFAFPLPVTRIWVPRVMDTTLHDREKRLLQIVGRLAPGVTIEQAQEELDRINAAIAAEFPDTHRYRGARIASLRSALNFADEIIGIMSAVLVAAHILVLGIVCANLSGLFLSRAMRRSRELSIRLALGGSRRRLVRLILLEPIVLALSGAIPGLALAAWLCRLLDGLVPPDLYRVGTMRLDVSAAVFTIALALVTASVASLLPAIRMSRNELADTLRATSLSTTTSRDRGRVQGALVVVEVALGVMLLVGALLMAKTVDEIGRTDLGYSPDKVLTARVSLRADSYPDADARRAFARRVIERLETLPGVVSASTANHLPLNHEYSEQFVRMSGNAEKEETVALFVGPSYFETMGIALAEGQGLDGVAEGDDLVAVVSSSFADEIVGSKPLGKTFLIDDEEVRIVGVATDVAQVSIEEKSRPMIYLSHLQTPVSYFRFLVRSESPETLARSLPQAVSSIDPDMPVVEVRTLEQVIGEYVLPRRVMSVSLSGLSLGALLLAAVGLYGLMAFFVAQQTREIGVRLALGASPTGVVRMIVLRGMKLAGWGAVAGIAGSLLLVRLMRGLLLGVGGVDLAVLAAVPLIVFAIVAVATASPALRASKLEPSSVLRAE